MKKLLYIPMLLCLMIFASSCEKSLEELNIDPTKPSDVNLNLLMPEILSSSAFNEGNNPNRVAGIVMQQLYGLDAQQLAYNSYVLGEDVMNNYWNTGLYAGVLRSCDVIITKSAEAGRPFYGAVAKIVMANEYGKATSMFGDIPLSEAFKGTEVLRPVYDSQESVYATIQTMLDDAIRELEAMADGGGYFGGDLVYGGDTAAWAKAAHAFKARYYMHTAKRNNADYANALSEANKSFASNDEAPYFQFETSQTANWSLAKFGIERPSTLGIDDRFAAMMDGDPRQPKYMEFADPFYIYFDDPDEGDLVWGRSDANVPLISFVEMQFIRAEVNARNNGSAGDMLADAIQASFDLLGVEDDGYIAANSSTGDVQQIIEEAYKAYYGFNFHETWTNWRRTGFPEIVSNVTSGSGLNPSGAVPVRYLYVEGETQTNRANVEAARARQGGGLLDAPLWAFE